MWVVVVVNKRLDSIDTYGPFTSEKEAGLWVYHFTFNVHDDPQVVKVLEVV